MKNLTKKLSYAIYIVLAAFVFYGCSSTTTETITSTKHINVEVDVIVKHLNTNDNLSIITIDECEYIQFNQWSNGDNQGYALVHKGNCKYCISRSKK